MPRDERTPRDRRAWILRWASPAVFFLVAGATFLDGHILSAFACCALGVSFLSSATGLRERSALLKRATQLVELAGIFLAAAAIYARLVS